MRRTVTQNRSRTIPLRWPLSRLRNQPWVTWRSLGPALLMVGASTVAHAQQGSMDFSGATTLMNAFKTFAMYAGAVICLGSLVFAGIRLMSGRFQEAIPALFGALFGAGVLGWGAGWISSLTGQSVSSILVNHTQWMA